MKSVSNLATTIGILVILFACAVSVVPQAKVVARKKVKVYFYHDPGEYIDLAPVTRSVSSAGPARPGTGQIQNSGGANSEAIPIGATSDCFTQWRPKVLRRAWIRLAN